MILQIVRYAPLIVGVYVVSDNTRFVVVWGAGLVSAVGARGPCCTTDGSESAARGAKTEP